MKKLCLALTFCTFLSADHQIATALGSENFWIRQIGSRGFDQGNDITIDKDGSVIVVGSFSGTAEFDHSTVLQSAGKKDIFIAKYDSSGNFLWAQRCGSVQNDRLLKSSIDPDGSIVVTGSIGAGGVQFGGRMFYTAGPSDMFIAKLTPDGQPIWARNFGGNSVDEGTAVAVDLEGNYIVTGWFRGRIKFDNIALNSAGEYDVFIAKLDKDGQIVWAKRGGGPLHDYGYALALDRRGNSYVTGRFHGSVIFDNETLHSAGETDIFIAKYNNDGALSWIRKFGGIDRDEAFGIAYDEANDHVVATGSFSDALRIDETGQTLTTFKSDDVDMIVLCLDPDGRIKWARSERNDSFGQGESVAIDHLGNIFIAGVFGHNLYFGANVLLSRGDLDGFIIKYSRDGIPEWVAHAGGGAREDTAFVAIPAQNGKDMYVTGSFRATSRFRDQTMNSVGDDDAFVMRLPEPNETATLFPQAEPLQYVGQEYRVEIKVGENKNVHQIDFDLLFSEFEFISIKKPLDVAVLPGPYLGSNGTIDAILNEDSGRLKISAKRNAPLAESAEDSVLAIVTFVSSLETEFGLKNEISLLSITAQNDVGEEITVTPGMAIVAHVGVSVWPGDTNNDAIVNEADVLPIGQFFGSTGPERRERSRKWKEQMAAPWDRIFSTFADADGDGEVEKVDVIIIGLHWKKESGMPETSRSSMPKSTGAQAKAAAGTSLIYMQANDENTLPGQIWIEVMADSVNDLFGLAYDLTYQASSPVKVRSIASGTLLPDPIFFANNDTTQGRIAIALAQKGQVGGVSGQGMAARILFDIGSYPLEAFLSELGIEDVSGFDSRGDTIEFRVARDVVVTDIANTQEPSIPTEAILYPNSPNPFNPATAIRYDLPGHTHVSLKIFDQLGKAVRTLVDERQQSGMYTVSWDGRDQFGRQVASGIYIYLLKTDRYMKGRRMLLVK